MEEPMIIDFSNYPGPVYTGRPRGEEIRRKLRLDAVDDTTLAVEIRIPPSTYSLTSSFFLGMFGPSIVKAGSQRAFFKKFHFSGANQVLTEAFSDYVARALQEKKLFPED